MTTSKVLIAEDNELNMKLFNDLLTFKNIQTICIYDGNKVIDAVLEHKPDLILMDIRLNGISGIDIVQDIKKNELIKNIPIVALTAFVMKNEQEKILKSGCCDYISKPISIDHFFATIEKYISLKTMQSCI